MLLCRVAKNRDQNVNTQKRKPDSYTKRLNGKQPFSETVNVESLTDDVSLKKKQLSNC